MQTERKTIALAVDASGNGAAFSPAFTGEIQAILYVPDGATPYDNTVDFTITLEGTAENVWTESNIAAAKTRYPVVVATLPAGTNSTLTERPVRAAQDRLKIALAQGGNAKTGSFVLVINGSFLG